MPAEVKQAIQDKKQAKAKQYQKTAKSNAVANLKPATGQWAVFTEIWLKRKRECTGCGRKLYVMEPTLFSHTVKKYEDKEEELILAPENIELECYDCHHIWDKGTWSEIVRRLNFKRRMEYIKQVRPDLYEKKADRILEYTGINLNEI